MIRLDDFSIGYGKRWLLENISTEFRDSTLTAVIGRNGTGKSTMLRAIAGINDKYEGQVLIDGIDIKKISRQEMAKKLAFVNTRRPRIPNMKCFDVVALGRSPYTGWSGSLSSKDIEAIKKALQDIGMESYANKQLDSLSDGECQKIMIARAIAQDTEIIILDEPTSFLDFPTRHELVALLKRLTEAGKTILFSTHELDIALKYSDYITLLDNGSLYNLPTPEMIAKGYLQTLFNN